MKQLLRFASAAAVSAAFLAGPAWAFTPVTAAGSGVVQDIGVDSLSVSEILTTHGTGTYDYYTNYEVDSSSWVSFAWGTSADIDLVIWTTVSSFGYEWNSQGGDVIGRTFTGPDYLSFPGNDDPTVSDGINYTTSSGILEVQLSADMELNVDCTDFYWGRGYGDITAHSDKTTIYLP